MTNETITLEDILSENGVFWGEEHIFAYLADMLIKNSETSHKLCGALNCCSNLKKKSR